MSLNLFYNQAGLELTTFASQELDLKACTTMPCRKIDFSITFSEYLSNLWCASIYSQDQDVNNTFSFLLGSWLKIILWLFYFKMTLI